MKSVKKSILLPALVLGGGAVGIVLRLWQLGSRDAQGLIPRFHAASLLLTALSVGVAVGVLLLTRNPGGKGRYYDNFPPSRLRGGCILGAAAGLFLALLAELISRPATLTVACDLVGLAAAYSLAFTGYCRMVHKRPGFQFHTVACIFFALRLISQYRNWSSSPQVMLYLWELLAVVCLMLSSYHRAAFDLNMGHRRASQVYALMSLYFCLLSLGGTSFRLFYGAMALWQGAGLCTLDPLPPDPEPAPEGDAPEAP